MAGKYKVQIKNSDGSLSDLPIVATDSEKLNGQAASYYLNYNNLSNKPTTATTSANGLMSSSDKTKLNGIATGATKVTTDTVSGWGYTKNVGTVTSVKIGSTSYSPSSGVVSLPAYPTAVTIDTALSGTSTNPVQNKVINTALAGKLGKTGYQSIRGSLTVDSFLCAYDDDDEFEGRGGTDNFGGADMDTYYYSKGITIEESLSDEVVYNLSFPKKSGTIALLSDITSGGSSITVDTALSSTSTNPVQNKVINSALNSKLSRHGGSIDGDLTIFNSLSVYDDDDEYLGQDNFSGNDVDTTYYAKGIYIWDDDDGNDYTLSFPAKAGTLATLDDATQVIQKQVTTNGEYPILMSSSPTSTIANPTAIAYRSRTNLYANPSTGKLSATSFNTLSDRRLKENIKEFTPKKSILDIPVVEFDFKESGLHQIGCIAQDLQEICPEIVNENAMGHLSIEESKIVYLLLHEVKKLKAEVEALKKGV